MIATRLDRLISECQDRVNRLTRQLERREAGRLVINRREKKTYYYVRHGSKREGISYDMKRVYRLARTHYRDAKLEKLKQELAVLKLAEVSIHKINARSKLNTIEERYSNGGLDLIHATCSEWQISNSGKQSQNPYRREDLIWKTRSGILTRSKSERTFCERLEIKGIPSRYEMEIIIDVTGLGNVPGSYSYKGRRLKKIYPDFTIFLADGTILIIEHVGLMDNGEYRRRTGEKLLLILYSGVVDQSHLLVTFEKDFEDIAAIDAFIDTYLKPYV